MLANRINSVTIRNYRSLEDVTVDLDDLTVLVGPNGSGKSSVLDALHFVSNALNSGMSAVLYQLETRRISDIRHYSFEKKNFPEFEILIELQLNEQKGIYGFVLGPNSEGNYVVRQETCRLGEDIVYETKNGKVVESTLENFPRNSLPVQETNLILPLVADFPEAKPLYSFLKQIRVYRLPSTTIRERLITQQGGPDHLLEGGENLGWVLYDLINRSNWREDILRELTLIVPGISPSESVRVEILDGIWVAIKIKHHDGTELDLAQESDGTLRILALLAALYQTPPPPMMGIEEPELMVHPGALGVLADQIHAASHRGQIILTTHSPDLISRFSAKYLRIVELVNGVTKIGPLNEDQRKIIEDKLFSGGDLLRIEGLSRRG